MTGTVGLLETTGLTPAMVAMDVMIKAAAIRVLQVELNDLLGVCVKIGGATADVQTAMGTGERVAREMGGQPAIALLTQVSASAAPALRAAAEVNPLIQQAVVFSADQDAAAAPQHEEPGETVTHHSMKTELPMALGFIETQGFTAVFEAIDTACKAASVEVVAKEKLGGGYITVVIQGELSAVSSAIAAAKEKVEGLGKLIAAHVIARPSEPVLKLLQKI